MISRAIQRLGAAGPRTRVAVGATVGTLLLGAGIAGVTVPGGSTPDNHCFRSAGEPDGPDGWGGCWPGPRTTGIPVGTELTKVPAQATSGRGWEWDARDGIVTISDDGAVIAGLDVAGGFYVRGRGVTIQGSRATFVAVAPGAPASYCHEEESAAIRALTECTVVPGISDDAAGSAQAPRTVLEDSEIDFNGTPDDPGTCVTGRNLDIRRTDISGCENGLDADSYVTITDSYVHDLYNSAHRDPHTDALQSGVGAHLVLEHNVFYGFTSGCTFPDDSGSCNGTSAINIGGQPDLATVRDTLVRRNLLAGGAYTLYCPARPPTDFKVEQNWFSTVYTDTAPRSSDRRRVGEYGPQSDCERTGVQASGNEIFDLSARRAVPLALTAQ